MTPRHRLFTTAEAYENAHGGHRPAYFRVPSEAFIDEFKATAHPVEYNPMIPEPNFYGTPLVIAGSPDDLSRQQYKQPCAEVAP